MKIFTIILGLMVFSSCSDTESWEQLSFTEVGACEIGSDISFEENFGDIVDTVYFLLRQDGAAEATMQLGWSCGGIKYYLVGECLDDTLFIDSRTNSDVVASCSCVQTVKVTIPAAFADAKVLVYDRKRRFPRTIVKVFAE